jgi:hypothetical protein
MEKDMKLAAEAARQVGAKLVLGDTAIGAYSSAASDPSFRDRDSRVVYKWYVHRTCIQSEELPFAGLGELTLERPL